MNIKKVQKLRPFRVNFESAIKYVLDRDCKLALKGALEGMVEEKRKQMKLSEEN